MKVKNYNGYITNVHPHLNLYSSLKMTFFQLTSALLEPIIFISGGFEVFEDEQKNCNCIYQYAWEGSIIKKKTHNENDLDFSY